MRGPFTAYFDGCCEPTNPGGHASYGAVIYERGARVWECSELFVPTKGKETETSNNVAEYSGFLAILNWFVGQKLTAAHITIQGDSMLVIKQCFGAWKIRKGHYKPLALAAREMVKRFPNLKGKWIPREMNGVADELSKAELVKAGVEFRIQPND